MGVVIDFELGVKGSHSVVGVVDDEWLWRFAVRNITT